MAVNLANFMYRLSWNLGAPNFWKPQAVHACAEIALISNSDFKLTVRHHISFAQMYYSI
jgi:hypothetical protein